MMSFVAKHDFRGEIFFALINIIKQTMYKSLLCFDLGASHQCSCREFKVQLNYADFHSAHTGEVCRNLLTVRGFPQACVNSKTAVLNMKR